MTVAILNTGAVVSATNELSAAVGEPVAVLPVAPAMPARKLPPTTEMGPVSVVLSV